MLNATQLAFTKTLLSGPNPTIVEKYAFSTNSASLSMSFPKPPGTWCFCAIYNFGGTAVPSTPTGLNLSSSAAATATVPGTALCRKYFNGSEAFTITSTAVSATAMVAHVYLFKNSPSLDVSTITTTVGANPALRQWFNRALFITGCAWPTTNTVTQYPAGFTTRHLLTTQATNLFVASVAENLNLWEMDPTAFAATTASNPRCYSAAFPLN